ncbi:MAG: hypothetical protein U5Q44_02940 [Dehalococcoidia bacterium]|nr:hypothetical protein [Dehalococcoidia bacterium]
MYSPASVENTPTAAPPTMINGICRTIRPAVAAGATSIAITSTTPTSRNAITAASATSARSPGLHQRDRHPGRRRHLRVVCREDQLPVEERRDRKHDRRQHAHHHQVTLGHAQDVSHDE